MSVNSHKRDPERQMCWADIRRTRKVLGPLKEEKAPGEGVTIQSLKGPVRPWGGWDPGHNVGNPQFPLLPLVKWGSVIIGTISQGCLYGRS